MNQLEIAANESRAGFRDESPSILAVTSELFWPLNTGGHIRTYHLLKALSKRSRLRVVVPVRPGQGAAVEVLRRLGIVVIPVEMGFRRCHREMLRVLSAAMAFEPYILYRRHKYAAVRSALRSEADRETPDVLYLDHLDSWLYRDTLPDVPSVVDLHNVYSTLARRVAEEQGNPLSRLYLGCESALIDRIERRVAAEADVLMAVSESECDHYASFGARDVRLIPNGVDCDAYESLPVGRLQAAPSLVFVGALSWMPNVTAARFLAEEVLPSVRASIPEARLRIVGRDPGPETLALGLRPGVEVCGSVPDILPYLRDASLLAVPLSAGGGTRLKILEAFAAGLPVVSTSIGAEGIEVRDGEHLVIASRSRFAEAIVGILGDPRSGAALASRARGLARDRYDWSSVGLAAANAVGAAALSSSNNGHS